MWPFLTVLLEGVAPTHTPHYHVIYNLTVMITATISMSFLCVFVYHLAWKSHEELMLCMSWSLPWPKSPAQVALDVSSAK